MLAVPERGMRDISSLLQLRPGMARRACRTALPSVREPAFDPFALCALAAVGTLPNIARCWSGDGAGIAALPRVAIAPHACTDGLALVPLTDAVGGPAVRGLHPR